jgi:hypothetical protein
VVDEQKPQDEVINQHQLGFTGRLTAAVVYALNRQEPRTRRALEAAIAEGRTRYEWLPDPSHPTRVRYFVDEELLVDVQLHRVPDISGN